MLNVILNMLILKNKNYISNYFTFQTIFKILFRFSLIMIDWRNTDSDNSFNREANRAEKVNKLTINQPYLIMNKLAIIQPYLITNKLTINSSNFKT